MPWYRIKTRGAGLAGTYQSKVVEAPRRPPAAPRTRIKRVK